MLKHLIIIVSLISSFSFAQIISIDWQGVDTYSKRVSPDVTIPYCTNEGYSVLYNSTDFTYKQETPSYYNIDIVYVYYSNVTYSSLVQMNWDKIPERLE